MKKLVSLVLVCLLLVSCVAGLSSCGKMLVGEYKNALTGISYAFSVNKVTVTVDNLMFDDSVYEGTYELKQNDEGVYDIITFTFENENAQKLYGGDHSFAEGTENGVSYIRIGLVTFDKVQK